MNENDNINGVRDSNSETEYFKLLYIFNENIKIKKKFLEWKIICYKAFSHKMKKSKKLNPCSIYPKSIA